MTETTKLHIHILILVLMTLTFIVGLYSDIYRPIFFKLSIVSETTKLHIHILISVLMTLTFLQGHSCMRNPKHRFLGNLDVDLDEIQFVIFKGENPDNVLL